MGDKINPRRKASGKAPKKSDKPIKKKRGENEPPRFNKNDYRLGDNQNSLSTHQDESKGIHMKQFLTTGDEVAYLGNQFREDFKRAALPTNSRGFFLGKVVKRHPDENRKGDFIVAFGDNTFAMNERILLKLPIQSYA